MIGVKSVVRNAGDAVIYFEHHPAAFAMDLAVVAASLAVAQRKEADLPEEAKPYFPEQAVSVTLELTLGTANRMMKIGLRNLVRANWADLKLVQE